MTISSIHDATIDADGFDPDRLADAIAFHRAHESAWPRSMMLEDGRYVGSVSIGDRPEHAAVRGPVVPRGGPNGLIYRHGRLAAEWGDTQRVDMTFSVAKSFLSILAGIAQGDGLLPDLDRPVGEAVPGPWFASAQNRAVTWRHLLHLTSEWSGTLWGKPDVADHHRVAGAPPDSRKGLPRPLQAPGAFFEYNDVRVNLLAACLTVLFARPLSDVLRERIMAPIGASDAWQWHGYEGGVVEVDGRAVPAVVGGGHWGGGLVIASRDLAKVGLLVAGDGSWEGRRILPAGWVREMTTPSPRNPQYGLFWWLNGSAPPRHPALPADSFFALGAGSNVIWIAPSLALVAVLRWIDTPALDAMLDRIAGAVR